MTLLSEHVELSVAGFGIGKSRDFEREVRPRARGPLAHSKYFRICTKFLTHGLSAIVIRWSNVAEEFGLDVTSCVEKTSPAFIDGTSDRRTT
jgi:hypothetical protein